MDEFLTLEVKISTGSILKAVDGALSDLLAQPTGYNSGGGEGYQHIKAQVLREVLRIDASEIIREMAKAKLREVVEDVTVKTLRDAIRKQARILRDGGMLFEGRSS